MTKRLSFLLATISAVPAAVFAQAPASAPAAPSASANPISVSTARMYTVLSGTVVAAAEKMPEENYSFKPTPEVRSFGQLVGHLADSQYFFCSSVAGEAKPPAGGIEKSKTSKADLVAALKDAVAYCTKTYDAMTDAKGGETMKLMNFEMAKLVVLSANTAHDYEHYGNMVTYMRMKGIVPPSSEKKEGSARK